MQSANGYGTTANRWSLKGALSSNELARFISPEEMVRTMVAGDCSVGAGFHTSANQSLSVRASTTPDVNHGITVYGYR